MSESTKMYKYKASIEYMRLVSKDEIMEAAGVSLALFMCNIVKLHDQMGMLIEYVKDRGGHCLARNNLNIETSGLC